MSKLIQRMIQRANGPLSGIEPLLLPRYARGREEAGDPFSGAEQGYAENVTVADTNIRRGSPELFAESPRGLRTHPVESDGKVHPKDRSEKLEAHLPSHTPEKPQPQPSMPLATPASKESHAVTVSSRSTHEVVVKPIAQHEKQVATPHEVLPARTGALPRIPGKRAEGVSGSLKEMPRKEAERDDIAMRTRPVTISIGHIEVRAAQPPVASPRKPAFRPGVSLAQFLKREGGARS